MIRSPHVPPQPFPQKAWETALPCEAERGKATASVDKVKWEERH